MAMLTYQPFKAVYLLVAASFELLRLPLFLVTYLVRHGRQHVDWSFRQAIAVRLAFSVVHHIARIQQATRLPLAPGQDKKPSSTIKPGEKEMTSMLPRT